MRPLRTYLFSFAPTRESLLLRAIVRTRFQFVGAAFVAVEVNDLLGSIAFFGHSASPSETIRVALVCWLATAEAPASQVGSASCYRLPKNIFFFSVVEPELKLIQVRRQIFLAHVVIRADHAALQQRPERFHVVRVDGAAHVLAALVADGLMRQALPAFKVLIAGMFIGRDQRDFFFVHYFVNEPVQSRHIRVLDHLADYVALAGDRADDRSFVASAAN